MNMNKKLLFFLLCFMSLTIFSLDVYAGCNMYASQGEEVCIQQSQDGFKCEYDGKKKGGSRCFKGDVPTQETLDNITSCSEISQEFCAQSTVNGKKCIWRQTVCMEAFEDNTGDSDYQIDTDPSDDIPDPNEIDCYSFKTDATCNANNICKWDNEAGSCKKKTCELLDQSTCEKYGICNWNETNNVCEEEYVASQPCKDDNILTAIRFFGYILLIAKVAIPVIIIIMGTIDLFKSVVDKDEKSLGKQIKMLLMRIVGGMFVFFIPTIVYTLFGISTTLEIVDEDKYKACVNCLIYPTDANKCNIQK